MDDRTVIRTRASMRGRVNAAVAAMLVAAFALVRGAGAQDAPPGVPPNSASVPESPNSTKALERDPVPGDRVILVFLDGQRVEGEFVRSEPAFALVKVANVESPFERSTLSQIIVIETPLVRFKRLRGAIRESDTERRTDLAEWAKDQGLYDEGLAEVQGVLKLDPGSADAIRLRGELESLIRLRDAAKRNAATPAVPGEPDGAAVPGKVAHPTRPQLGEFPLLTDEQVNTIKVYEVDLKNPPKITISRETIDKLLTRYADHPLIPTSREAKDGFRLLPPEKILETMFRVRARDLYSEVKVVDNPASMKKFREQVHSAWLVNNCATTRCHGGSAAGRLLLTNRRPNADQSVYTNFLIIDRFQTAEGRPLVNWAEPERSVLLQMGLPRDDALTPHPEVKGWSPVFRSRDDRRFGQAVEWMKMMYRPRPEYGVEYPAKEKEGGDEGKVPEVPER
jgi:hypothetical protein